jgi:hypothetical protein
VSRKSSGDGDLTRLSTTSNRVEEFEIRATLLSDSLGVEEFSESASSQFMLRCPSCESETFVGDKFCQECGCVQPAFAEKSRLSSEAFLSVLSENRKNLYLWVGVCVGVLFVLITSVLYLAVPGDLEKALSTNKLNDAAIIADRLLVSRLGVLQGRDAELYSDAFFRRAQVFAKNKNYKFAFVDLSKVQSSYSKRAEASQLRNLCTILVAQGNNSTPQTSPRATSDAAANSQAAAQSVRIESSTAKQFKTQSNSQAMAQNRPSKSLDADLRATGVSPSSLPAEKPAPSANTNSVKDEVDSEEADMAAYNRHLAEYFSRQGLKDSKDSRDSKASKAAGTKELPSFSEWVQSGKSEF